MRLKDETLSKPLESLVSNISLADFTRLTLHPEERTTAVVRNKKYESKLLNSEFTLVKFVYDSFAAPIRLEAVKLGETTVSLPVKFKQTNTINSKMLFDLGYRGENYEAVQDFENILAIGRNNEETIFSNGYIDYIRNGYNYDQKVRFQDSFSRWAGTAIGIGTAGASGLAGLGIFNPAWAFPGGNWGELGDAAINAMGWRDRTSRIGSSSIGSSIHYSSAINSAGSAVSGIFSNIISDIQAGQQIEQHLKELSRQSTSVAGSDDVDLMKYYSDNKLHMFVYKPYEKQEDGIFDLFHYCGYSHHKTQIPNTTNRYWFNYVQCDPVFDNEETSPYNRFLDDIRARYQKGITIYHYHILGNGGTSSYDWDQQLENWETSLAVEKLFNSMIDVEGEIDSVNITSNGIEIDNVNRYVEFRDVETGTYGDTQYQSPLGAYETKTYQLDFLPSGYRIVDINNSASSSDWTDQ